MGYFEYQPIEVINTISKKEFQHNYVKPQKPVVIKNMAKDWRAYENWNFEYLKEIAGEKIVPLYDNSPVDAEKKVNEPIAEMTLGAYLDLLEKEPTDLRIFLYNLMKHVPQLREDFEYPDLGLRLFKTLPMLFFGGENSNVFMHYDIDLANILHFHFVGSKECILVAPQDTKYMYKVPYAWISREDIDFDDPDFEQFPALEKITPLKAELSHGDMLYIPEGYWHYMKYITPGFSMSLRSLAHQPKHVMQAITNVFFVRNYDNLMRNWMGNKWIAKKDERAYKRSQKWA